MAKEPEPRSTGQNNNPSYSIESQSDEFTAKLPELKVTRIIPGFLFRDGDDRIFEFSPKELKELDENLLSQHVATYRKALEVRDQLLQRIKPVEILGLVREIWGRGEIGQTWEGTKLTHSYPKVAEQWRTTTTYEQHYDPINGNPSSTRTSTFKTGKWFTYTVSVIEDVGVRFGNAEFPYHLSTHTNQLDEFFADRCRIKDYRRFFPKDYIPEAPKSPKQGKALEESKTYDRLVERPLFKGIPRTIWRKPDNLGIYVTVPYTIMTDEDEANYSTSKPCDIIWFNQSASQQDIIDYLAQRLEAQRRAGQLPSQMEELELAKIDELRKRGLFTQGPAHEYIHN